MKGIMKIMFLSCKQAAALSSKQSVEPLSFKERVQFSLHTSMCEACKAFHRQNELLDAAIAKALSEQGKIRAELTPEQKKNLKSSIPV